MKKLKAKLCHKQFQERQYNCNIFIANLQKNEVHKIFYIFLKAGPKRSTSFKIVFKPKKLHFWQTVLKFGLFDLKKGLMATLFESMARPWIRRRNVCHGKEGGVDPSPLYHWRENPLLYTFTLLKKYCLLVWYKVHKTKGRTLFFVYV